MSASDSYKIAFALQQTNRAMSMLSLVEAALRHEMKFQDERVKRPNDSGEYIPGLGEVIDTIEVCREELGECWSALNGKDAGK